MKVTTDIDCKWGCVSNPGFVMYMGGSVCEKHSDKDRRRFLRGLLTCPACHKTMYGPEHNNARCLDK